MEFNQIPNFAWTLGTGSNNLSGNQYKGVKVGAQGATVIAAATDKVVGFQTDNPTGANQLIALESNGIVLAICGAAVTAGAEVSIMATGAIEDQNASNTTVGHALKTGVTGDIVSIKLKNM